MTHGREKSDLGIVAMKSANKFARANAESMELRGGAKENASQSNKHRTQSRRFCFSASGSGLVPTIGTCTRESEKP